MLELEGLQSAERRALLPYGARLGSRADTGRYLPVYQAMQVVFQQVLEVTGRFERMKRRDQRAFCLVVKPFVDELVEFFLLCKTVEQLFFVVKSNGGWRSFPIDEQIRFAALAETFDGLFKLELSAGFVS